MVKVVRERIRRNPSRSQRKLAAEIGTSRQSVQRILKDDLHMHPYKRRKRQRLTTAHMGKRVIRSRELLSRHDGLKILFSDEKLFTVEEKLNAQNDRVYGVSISDIPTEFREVDREKYPASVMVWGGFSSCGKTPLVFLEKGVRLTAQLYIQQILDPVVKHCGTTMFLNNEWCFQQDGAPCHTAKITQKWLQENCPDFIKKDSWPPQSPDLNPLDYFMWSYLEAKVNSHRFNDLETLKQAIRREWDAVPMDMCRAATASWSKRLRACIKAKGGHFEV